MLNVDNSHLVQCSTIVGWQHEISIGAAFVYQIHNEAQYVCRNKLSGPIYSALNYLHGGGN